MNILNISTKSTGDSLSATEFNEVVSAVNTVNSNEVTDASNISSNTSSISTLTSGLSTANTNISTLNTSLATKANSSDVYTKANTYSKTEVTTLLDSVTISQAVINTTGTIYGEIVIGGTTYDLYRQLFSVTGLPTVSGVTSDLVLSNSPLGFNLFCYVDGYSLSSGSKINGEFLMNAYTINKVYINSSLQTVMNITCNQNISTTYTMYVVLMYIKPDYYEVNLDISLPTSVTVSDVTFSFPTFKYDKKTIFTQITDDSYAQLNRFSNFVRGRDVNVGTGNWAQWVHTDGSGNDAVSNYASDPGNTLFWTPPFPLAFSDGCGKFVYPANSCIIWPGTPNYMENSSLDWYDMVDFGISPDFHDVWNPYTDSNDSVGYGSSQSSFDTCVSTTRKYVYDNIISEYMKTMIIPNGDETYVNYDINNSLINIQIADSKSWSSVVYPYASNFTLQKTSVPPARRFATSYQNVLDALNDADPTKVTTKENRIWSMLGNHRLGNEYLGIEELLYSLRLIGGSDDTWVPSVDEYYEYWYNCNNSLTSKISGTNGITYNMYIPKLYNFYHPTMSLLVSNVYNANTTSKDTLNLQGTATSNGNVTITRGSYSDTISYTTGDTAAVLAYNISKSTAFTDSTLSVDNESVKFTSNSTGEISQPIFVDNNGQSQIVTFTLSGTVTAVSAISFYVDFSENSLSYTPTSGQTAIEVCNAIKLAQSSNTSFIGWSVDTTSGVNTITFTKKYDYTADTPTFTANNSGLSASVSITQTGKNNNFQGAWNRGINGFSVTSDDCEYLSYGVDSNTESNVSGVPNMLINFGYGTNLTTTATKYTNRYVGNKTRGNGIDAQYFVNLLSDSNTAKSSLQTTLDTYLKTPVLTSFILNEGVTTTSSLTIPVSFISSITPTYYMISEDSGFSGATWQAYSSNITYTLNDASGSHTVYFKVKNSNGSSNVLSSIVSYSPQNINLTAVSINSGASSTSSRTVTLTYTATGGTPTYYMASEDSTFTNGTWIAMTDTISFTLSSGSATKTVYFKLKNNYYTSSIVSSSIAYQGAAFALDSISINSGATYSSSEMVTVTINAEGENNPTGYKLSETSNLSDVTSYTTYTSSSISYTFSSYGTKTLYCQITDGTSTSTIKSATIIVEQPVELTSISINSGASTVNIATVSVAMVYTGTPTYYMISTTSGFTGASWVAFTSSTITYTLASTGSTTLYVKLMNDVTTASSTQSAVINYIQVVKFLMANMSSGVTDSTYGYINGSNSSIFSGTLSDTKYSTDKTKTFNLSGLYFLNPTQRAALASPYISTVVSGYSMQCNLPAYSNHNTPSFTGTGTYSNDYLWNSTDKFNYSPFPFATNQLETSSTSPVTCSVGKFTGFDSGTYKLRFLPTNTESWWTSANTEIYHIKINDSDIVDIAGNTFDTTYWENNTNWIEVDNITVGSDGNMIFMGWATVAINGYHFPDVTFLEITKTA